VVTYQNDRFASRVQDLITHYNNHHTTPEEKKGKAYSYECDIRSDASVQNLCQSLPSLLSGGGNEKQTSKFKLNALVHSVAHAPTSAMKGSSFLDTTLDDYISTHDVSSYSLLRVARYALPYLSAQYHHTTERSTASSSSSSSSITALTYLGSTKVVPNYNIMGSAKSSLENIAHTLAYELSSFPHSVRVNCVSAGPISTMASRGIVNLGNMKKDVEERSMLRRNITGEEVGNVVAFLAGEESGGVTGQTIFVDGGYGVMGGPSSVY